MWAFQCQQATIRCHWTAFGVVYVNRKLLLTETLVTLVWRLRLLKRTYISHKWVLLVFLLSTCPPAGCCHPLLILGVIGSSVIRSGSSHFNVVGLGASWRWHVADTIGNDNGEVKEGINDSTELMRLSGDGRLGIGTNTPEQPLDVRGGAFGNNQSFGILLASPGGEWKSGMFIKS